MTFGISEAMQALADAVTQCKFESSYPSFDETVLCRILDVLTAAVCCPVGKYLGNDNLLNIFQASYRIGHYQTGKGRATSELLTQASRRSMRSLVSAVFSRLHEMPADELENGRSTPVHVPRLQVSPSVSVSSEISQEDSQNIDDKVSSDEKATSPRQEKSDLSSDIEQSKLGEDKLEATSTVDASLTRSSGKEATSLDADRDQSGDFVSKEDTFKTAGEAEEHHGIVSVLSPVRSSTPQDESDMNVDIESHDILFSDGRYNQGYGIDALNEVLGFIIGFISSAPSRQHSEDLASHGLDLIIVILQVCSESLPSHDSLMRLLQQDLIKSMFIASSTRNLSTLAGICQVALCLHICLGKYFLVQIEALLGLLILPLAEGKGIIEKEEAAQIIALESILDFCRQPGFARDIYLNLDCRIERSNLFQQICVLLSKAAFPVSGPVSVVHLLSLEGILAILSSLAFISESYNGMRLVSDDDAQAQDLATRGEDHMQNGNYLQIWSALVQGESPKFAGIERLDKAAREEKLVKSKMATAAEHFNHDAKKGFQYAQSVGLLPKSEDPVALAQFLRFCPGLSKAGIGEVLGEKDAFYDEVRNAFMETFDFEGLEFETALRLYMDAFRPPGEGQKIDRLMQVFGRRYYNEVPDSGLKSEDAAYVLAFSVIMLNTDLHNTQNKKKMTLEDFARINRNTNEGDPMPPELLDRIYRAISSDELKISSECLPEELPSHSVFWFQMARDSQRKRGLANLGVPLTSSEVERDMFLLIWGPSLAAISIILESSNNPNVARDAIRGLLLAADLAAVHGLPDVPDRLIATLANHTAELDPSIPRAVVAFGASTKAQAAVEAIFALANKYGDGIRNGWTQVMDCMIRLYKAGLLSPMVIATDGESLEDAKARFPLPQLTKKSKNSSGSLFSRAINSLISIDSADDAAREEEAKREEVLESVARESAARCHIEDLIKDSKFLTSESLVELVKALMTSGGNLGIALQTGEGADNAELVLELLITVSLRNRDRISLIWPLVHEYLAACMTPELVEQVSPLIERAVLGLLRICQRLLPYKEDIASMLMDSLALTSKISPQVIWSLSEVVAREVLLLVRSCGPYVQTESGWRTVTVLIHNTAQRQEAAPASFEALNIACRNPAIVSGESYMPLLEVCLQLIDRFKVKNTSAALKFLDCADVLFAWLPQKGSLQENGFCTNSSSGALHPSDSITFVSESKVLQPKMLSDESLVDLWLTSVGVMARGLCREESKEIRDTSIASLHRTLLASSNLGLPPELWIQTIQELLAPLVVDLAQLATNSRQMKKYAGIEKSVRLAVNMLTKVMIQYTAEITLDHDFYTVWRVVLDSLQDCMNVRHEAVLEAVPENTKNMLLVMATCSILTPTWTDANGKSLWDLTWSKVSVISSALNPSMLQAAGLETIENAENSGNADNSITAPSSPGKDQTNQIVPSHYAALNSQQAEVDVVPTDDTTQVSNSSVVKNIASINEESIENIETAAVVPDSKVEAVSDTEMHSQGMPSGNADPSAEDTSKGNENEEEQPPSCKQS